MSVDFIKTIPQYLWPHQLLNALASRIAESKNVAFKNYLIQNFIKKFDVNMSEALQEDPLAYASFNDFFIRTLKPGARPLAAADIISPVDGAVSEIGSITDGQLLQAKGRYYTVAELLACEQQEADSFAQGRFATLYLSPKDYHRVHMPMDAELLSMTYIPGSLFSVQPRTTRVVPKLFARNERLAIQFKTKIGPMVMVMVGAAIVGAIGTSWHGQLKRSNKKVVFNYSNHVFHQGEEIGYFKLGSTVVLLFAQGDKMQWEQGLQAYSPIRLGQELGEIIVGDKRT